MAREVLGLVGKPPASILVCYLGTATYDIDSYETAQCKRFVEAGCIVTPLRITGNEMFTAGRMKEVVDTADVVLVSGGNTLYAINRWKAIGLDKLLRSAADRGTVMCGGSAGAICWFTAGHSDSADPDSYYPAMMKDAEESKDESSTLGAVAKPWKYIRVPCLDILPGLVVPHADKVQSNGVLRMTDFEEMMLRHPGERGITIDHFTALVVNGASYRIVGLEVRQRTKSCEVVLEVIQRAALILLHINIPFCALIAG